MKTLAQLAGGGEARIIGDGGTRICGLSADSRRIEPGFLFAALKGAAVDGAKFIPAAIKNGAAAILAGEETDLTGIDLPLVISPDPRRSLALMAARFYQKQPEKILAVTGTNGKTSIASFVRQIFAGLGHRAASLGTVGVEIEGGGHDYEHWQLHHTTPDPVEIHQKLARLAAEEGVNHLAIEASSHGLEQRRLDGVRLSAGAFTNITQDHLDYHGSMEEYFSQKLRLFSELLPDGAPVVLDADIAGAERVMEIARKRSLPIISVGRKGKTIQIADIEFNAGGQRLRLVYQGQPYEITTELIGAFQASNLLIAAGLALAAGAEWDKVWPLLGRLHGARGRMEIVGRRMFDGGKGHGAPLVVDYAHTPDALENAIRALRPMTGMSGEGGRIIVVFGCGGDRDRGKRPMMGAIAQKHADLAIVTDDNPRSEEPAAIRAQIMAAAPQAIEIGDRGEAIRRGVAELREGDILLIAGKGHEEGQEIKGEKRPFSDHRAALEALEQLQAG